MSDKFNLCVKWRAAEFKRCCDEKLGEKSPEMNENEKSFLCNFKLKIKRKTRNVGNFLSCNESCYKDVGMLR